jgi:hypothetical protein
MLLLDPPSFNTTISTIEAASFTVIVGAGLAHAILWVIESCCDRLEKTLAAAQRVSRRWRK